MKWCFYYNFINYFVVGLWIKRFCVFKEILLSFENCVLCLLLNNLEFLKWKKIMVWILVIGVKVLV